MKKIVNDSLIILLSFLVAGSLLAGAPNVSDVFSSEVPNLSFSPDGKILVTSDGRLWNLTKRDNQGKAMQFSIPKARWVIFTRDGTKMLAANNVYDPSNMKLLYSVKNGSFDSFSPDSSKILVNYSYGAQRMAKDFNKQIDNLELLDASNGKLIASIGGERYSPKFSPDGSMIAVYHLTGVKDKEDFDKSSLELLEANNGKLKYSLDSSDNNSHLLFNSFSPDNTKIVVTNYNMVSTYNQVRTNQPNIQVFDANNGKLKYSLDGSENINFDSFSPDSTKIVVTTYNNDIAYTRKAKQVFDASNGKLLYSLDGRYNVIFSPDSKKLITSSSFGDDGSEALPSRLLDASNGKVLLDLGNKPALWNPSFSFDGSRILSVYGTRGDDSTNSGFEIWNAENGESIYKSGIGTASFSPKDSRIVVTAKDSPVVKVIDSTSANVLYKLEHDTNVYDAFFSPDGSQILSKAKSGAKLWKLP